MALVPQLSDESEDRMDIATRNDQGLTLKQSLERDMQNNGRRGTAKNRMQTRNLVAPADKLALLPSQ